MTILTRKDFLTDLSNSDAAVVFEIALQAIRVHLEEEILSLAVNREDLKKLYMKMANFTDKEMTTTANVYVHYTSYSDCPVCMKENTVQEPLDDGSMVECVYCDYEYTINRKNIMREHQY